MLRKPETLTNLLMKKQIKMKSTANLAKKRLKPYLRFLRHVENPQIHRYIWRPPTIQTLGWRPIWWKFNYLISYLDRSNKITRLKTASNCSMSICLSRYKLEAVIKNATIADSWLGPRLNTASNSSKTPGGPIP